MKARALWGRSNAFNVQKVLWALAELDLAYVHHEVGGAAGGLDRPEFLAMNPHGRVPVLQDGDHTVWESHSILRYLVATYPNRKLGWSESAAERSRADRWADWGQTTWQPDFMKLFWGFYRTPPDERNLEAVDRAKASCASHFALLDRELEQRPFLAGDTFTFGDIPVATSLYRYFEMGAGVEEPPHVMAWYRRLATRPAFQTKICVPFDELFGRLSF